MMRCLVIVYSIYSQASDTRPINLATPPPPPSSKIYWSTPKDHKQGQPQDARPLFGNVCSFQQLFLWGSHYDIIVDQTSLMFISIRYPRAKCENTTLYERALNWVNSQPSNGQKNNRQPLKMENFNRKPSINPGKI